MLTRVDSFFDFLQIPGVDRLPAQQLAAQASDRANGMTHLKDYEALAAVLLYRRPRSIFEIGTYLGVTSDFFLELLPECKVVSIAYVNPRWNVLKKEYNNSELSPQEIGSLVGSGRRSRFMQVHGDSHKLQPDRLTASYGPFDLVFIDGDHSREGVARDTELARKIIGGSGVICWHDANPKEKYVGVRRFLEEDLPVNAVATKADYVGGIACWNAEIEKKTGTVTVTPNTW